MPHVVRGRQERAAVAGGVSQQRRRQRSRHLRSARKTALRRRLSSNGETRLHGSQGGSSAVGDDFARRGSARADDGSRSGNTVRGLYARKIVIFGRQRTRYPNLTLSGRRRGLARLA